MNKKQKRKLISVICFMMIISTAIALVLYALKQNINLFYTPTQLLQTTLKPDEEVRLGGYVKEKSVKYDTSGQGVIFIVTDKKKDILVEYHGVLPNLFREGQGVVITGKLNASHFLADQVLAKHDEKYMPLSLAKSLGESH